MGYRQAVKAQHFDCCIVGSIPTSPVHGTLAQMVEHLTFNQVVGGSSPPCLTFFLFSFSFFCGGTKFHFCAVTFICIHGGIGRRGRFRFCWATPVQVRVLLDACLISRCCHRGSSFIQEHRIISLSPASAAQGGSRDRQDQGTKKPRGCAVFLFCIFFLLSAVFARPGSPVSHFRNL